MHFETQIALSVPGVTRSRAWHAVVAVLVCVTMPLFVYASSVLDMAAIWWLHDTYTHCFVVLPTFAYLVWRKRAELASAPIQPAVPALLGVLGAGLVWSLGAIAAAPTPGYFALVAMAASSVAAVLGWRCARVIWFPLAFLAFAVPFGESFIPTLMEWTADFTVLALRTSGIPVFREGQSFVIPSGRWSVIETCSGIRYLIASMFVGSLFSWLMFRSFARRFFFLATSVVVPIVANWMRAYMIVMLGHLSGNRVAVGVDHLLYGWVFFGLVMLLLFWFGSRWREDRTPAPAEAQPPLSMVAIPTQEVAWRRLAPMLAAVLVITLGWKVATAELARLGDTRPVQIASVESGNGWHSVADQDSEWRPRLRAPSAMLTQSFEKGDQRVTLVIGVYRNQNEDSKLVTSIHFLSRLIRDPWQLTTNTQRSIELGASAVKVNAAAGRRGNDTLVVWQWNWVWGRMTINDPWAKVALAVDRLLTRSDTSAWIAIYSRDEANGKHAREGLQTFAAEMGPAIDRALRETAAR